jgi:hypothetical protein
VGDPNIMRVSFSCKPRLFKPIEFIDHTRFQLLVTRRERYSALLTYCACFCWD